MTGEGVIVVGCWVVDVLIEVLVGAVGAVVAVVQVPVLVL
jgi:hypothetical protein